jgi:hypothetical protein
MGLRTGAIQQDTNTFNRKYKEFEESDSSRGKPRIGNIVIPFLSSYGEN